MYVQLVTNMSRNAQTSTSTPMNETIEGYLAALVDIAENATGHLMCTIKGTYPDVLYSGEPTKVTPAQARAALNRYLKSARKEMPKQAADMPEDFHESLAREYTVRAGTNRDGSPRPERKVGLWAYALSRVRRADKQASKKARNAANLAKAEAEGGHWFAQGSDTPYPSEKKARKAWARAAHGPDWWKTDKSARLDAAVVSRGAVPEGAAPSQPEQETTPAPAKTTQTTGKVTVKVLREKCKTLALPHSGTKADLEARILAHSLFE